MINPHVVAHLKRTFLPLTEPWIYDQIRFLRRYRSVILTSRVANRDRFPWETVYALERLSPFVRSRNKIWRKLHGFYPFFREVAQAEGAAMLHAHFGHMGTAALRLADRLNLPLITSFYGRDLSSPGSLKGLFANGTAFVAEGPFAARRLVDLGAPRHRVVIHRLGIDLDSYPFQSRIVHRGEPIRILMVGRFVEKKGFEYGLEAFARVVKGMRSLHLTIVGDAGSSSRERRVKQQLADLIRRHDLADRVTFTGFLDRGSTHQLLLEHHLLLQPSLTAADGDSEGGHPVVLTEAAASGMPIIATRHCDIPEIVIPGETGWLCEEREVVQLAETLADAVREPEAFVEMGRRARALVEAKYDGRRKTLDDIYAALAVS